MQIFKRQISNGALIMISAVIVIILLLASVFFGILPGSRPTKPPQTTLEFWGLFDNLTIWQPIFN